MEQLTKYKNTLKLPNDLVKISDLLEFEGPILSHFTAFLAFKKAPSV